MQTTRTRQPAALKRLTGQRPAVGRHYDTWFKNRDGSGCKLKRIQPYTGLYAQWFNCVLVFESDKVGNPIEMAYQINR